jgi:FMN phosphatase YigB (HAD superfamily)
MRSASEIDAVTVDAFGTAVLLEDPVEALRTALARRGVERAREEVAAAFRAEVSYYRPRSLRGRDGPSLAQLRRECVGIFLDALGADVDRDEFVPAFMDALVFRPAEGAKDALETLAAAGLELACVANWDVSLREQLDRAGLAHLFRTVLSSAEAGAEKPHPQIFRLALAELEVAPERALHVGDEPADAEGARAAGLAFEPAPLATLPTRLGLS